jgi:hypothetical protein
LNALSVASLFAVSVADVVGMYHKQKQTDQTTTQITANAIGWRMAVAGIQEYLDTAGSITAAIMMAAQTLLQALRSSNSQRLISPIQITHTRPVKPHLRPN